MAPKKQSRNGVLIWEAENGNQVPESAFQPWKVNSPKTWFLLRVEFPRKHFLELDFYSQPLIFRCTYISCLFFYFSFILKSNINNSCYKKEWIDMNNLLYILLSTFSSREEYIGILQLYIPNMVSCILTRIQRPCPNHFSEIKNRRTKRNVGLDNTSPS